MRTQLTNNQINDGLKKVFDKLQFRLDQKGHGTFSSRHEILGVITEEYKEFVDAVHSKDRQSMSDEILDLAVGAIFGMICFDEDTVEW